MRAGSIAVSAVLVAVVGLSGCASKDEGDGEARASDAPAPTATRSTTDSPSTTSEPTPAPNTIAIRIKGDTVTPNGRTVEVPLGEPVTFAITSDRPGELHVHSTPEQEVSFGSGSSEHTLTFDQPGVVAVESHDLHKVIVQLEVR